MILFCSCFQHLTTDFGLEVKWSGQSWVEVSLPVTMKNRTCGMCGVFNNNPADDWVVGPMCDQEQAAGTIVCNLRILYVT